MLTQITNGVILTPNGWLKGGSLILRDSKIYTVTEAQLPILGANIVDAQGQYIVPGFVAMDVYGANGHSFSECTKEAFDTITKAHVEHGATTIFPTIGPSSKEEIQNIISLCEEIMKDENTPVKGLHLVGPYLSETMTKHRYNVRVPNKEEYTNIVNSTDVIKRWDASPELEGALDFAKCMKKHNIVTAISHTEAEYEDVEKAYNAGYTHAAQLYNSMPGFHKRREYKYEGTVESVLLIDDMSTEIIADGKHLPGTILKLVYKLKGVEKLSLVTAALSYAAYEGEIPESDNIFIEDGVCKLKKDKSLVGSIATMDTLVKTMVQKADVPLMDAIRMASETPAKVMGILDKTGTLEEGKEANVVLMNDKLDVTSVWLKGTRVK